jgi:hypothetical protein
MKKLKYLLYVPLLVFSSYGLAGEWFNNQEIKEVSIKYGNGCIKLEDNSIIKIDLSSDAGRAEFSIVLAAKFADEAISVFRTDGDLIGGCDTGNTIRPHTMLVVR